jgi:soluble lytic murein transglycosylase
LVCGLLFLGGCLHRRTTFYDYWIAQSAARNDIDFYLVKALIYEESWFRAGIRGGAGEVGLMQVSMAAARDFCTRKGFPALSVSRLLEPDLNIEVGSWYLKQSLERYKDSPAPIVFALLRYNAGETRADEWLRQAKSTNPPRGMPIEDYCLSFVDFPKTKAYARRILDRSRSRTFLF